ncbi:Cell division trigger factor [Fructilactobacillus florum 8D]|uniref:Trigger factor n=1 Tax=Fructilactobacillus florum 8D TaxID=1221538 RepID=W9EGB7_9LACO|nr:trigger factor [Fructilactobacillus florum]ETO40030.1 Cell division trigger factor [Fructilactobacillus florum 8D]
MAEWNKKDGNKGELTFKIDLDKIKEGLDKAFNKNKKSIKVPGFRKGKVSRQVFNQLYGEETLYQDALNILLPDSYAGAVADAGIEAVGQPEINVESMEKGKPWVLKAVVSVKPAVELGEYKGVEVPKQNTRVYKKDIDEKLDSMRKSQAELVLIDGAAKKGDTVTIDFKGTVDGKAFEGGEATNYSLELGSGSFIPGFEDQLIGKKAGDDVDVKVTFPEDYQQKDLAGKAAVFATKVHEVKEKQLPQLDDDFAKDVDEDVDTLDELKEKLKKELKEQKESAAHDEIQAAAVTAATKNATVKDIPQVMLDEDIQRQTDQYLAGLQQQGISADMYFKMTNTSSDDLKQQFSKDSDERVKTSLVLEAIVKAEAIKPSDEEINQEVKNLADQYGMKEAAVRGALSDEMLSHDLAIQKAVDLIVDNAKLITPEKTEANDQANK